jgi:hypothetical protein
VFMCFFLPVAVLSPNLASCTVTEQRMEIHDLSDKGSPIQISGYMALRYDSGNRFPFSYEQSTSVKNVSSKDILLMIVHLEATSGPGQDETYSQEYFFGDTLGPGQVEVNHDPERRFGTTAYVLVGDTAGTTYDNATTLGYSPRGLPCAYISGVCGTPAAGYFVYYLTSKRSGGSTGWAAVVVTRAGRSKVVTWSGTAWQ